MQNQIICQNCNEEYRDDNLPRLLIGCGHTYCQNCILSFIYDEGDILYTRCPEDQTEMEVKEKNLTLIKVIESKKDIISFKDNQINVSKITKNSEVHEQQDTTQLISMMNDAKNDSDYENSQKQSQRQRQRQNQSQKERQKQKSKQKSRKSKASPVVVKQKKQQICAKHKKVLDIVCTVDLKKICASCAIFGEHRNHSFKSLQEVSQMQSEYCQQITSIINQKQKISRQLSASQTKNDILSILTNKKNKLKEKINEQFQKLETKMANKKKETLKKLDQIAKKQENNLKNCMKLDDQLIKNYEDWFSKSSSQLKILEENDFQSKLILLFEGKNIDGDIIEEGENLIQQMKISEQNILSEVQKKLQNLNITVNEEVYGSLEDFIRVYAESYKQISAIIIKNQFQAQNMAQIHSQYNSQTHSQYNSQNQQQNQVYPQIPILNINNYNSNRPQGGTERQKRKTPSPKYDNVLNSSYLQVSQPIINHALDESLLQNDEEPPQPTVDQFNLRMSVSVSPTMNFSSVPLTQRFSVQPNIQVPVQKIEKQAESKIKAPTKLNNSQNEIKNERMSKKKLSKMKLPDRYQKIVEGLLADTLQILDLTNAEIGDSNISLICQNIQNSRVKTLKLIRNKLTDEGISKIIPFLGQVTTLNLSQNLLTENVLDILYENKKFLGSLRAIILSQNKIIERKHKIKIDKLKKLEWNVSV